MKQILRIATAVGVAGLALALVVQAAPDKVDPATLLTGQRAFADYMNIKPGLFRKITAADLPAPFASPAAQNQARVVPRPEKAWPQALPGFTVELYATGLTSPRKILTAPNGDFIVIESTSGEVKVLRGRTADGKVAEVSSFASGLRRPYGLAFYPTSKPQWLYVGNTDSIVRFPYTSGDLKASAPAQVIVANLPASARGHWTRDLAFSGDGRRMLVGVGSASNVDDGPEEDRRANILEYTPDGAFVKIFASGIRNPGGGMAVHPQTGDVWTSVNERDLLGDNLVPDYITTVKEGGFYGWPWYYIGGHQDPRHMGKHPELKDTVLVPDVLLQPHNASLGFTFYDGRQFPAEYRGDLFAAQHGSWNKSVRTGYEVIRVPLRNGKATGEYQDFLTGFVTADGQVWGRPAGVTVAQDGALLVTDDGSNSVWRVSYAGK